MEREWNNLPTWLPQQISKLEMTVERFAWQSKVPRTSLYVYINGSTKPSTRAMAKICKALGVPLEEGLRQYSPTKMGRPVGSGGGSLKPVTVRTRK